MDNVIFLKGREKMAKSISKIEMKRIEWRRLFKIWLNHFPIEVVRAAAAVKVKSPDRHILQLQIMTLPCPVCKGTKTWVGKTGYKGDCFRCEKKGHFTLADCQRNITYDNNRKVK